MDGGTSGVARDWYAQSVPAGLATEGGPRGPRRARIAAAFLALGGGAAVALLVVVSMAWLSIALSWPHREPLGNPEMGINFSCNYAEYLLLEKPGGAFADDRRADRAEWCAATLGRLLTGLGARHVRISVEWSQVEPIEGAFDFRLIDALLAEAERDGARVVLTVGLKGQRHPEYYVPSWALAQTPLADDAEITPDLDLSRRALTMVRAVVAHVAASPAIVGWGADNEPYLRSERTIGWAISREMVQLEVAAIRAADPHARPVAIGHGQHFVFDRRWRYALADGDVLTASIYPFRNQGVFGKEFVVPILEIGPLAPNYAHQARAAGDLGRDYWITEMQAEPYTDGDVRLLSPANPSPNLTVARFRKSVEYARRTGASRVYLWGAEWWLYEMDRFGDSTWWDLGREAIERNPGGD